MSEKVVLEVPADASLLPVVRMVVGGMAARADLTISEIDELHMAVEEVLRAGHHPESTPRLRLEITAGDGQIQVTIGPFASPRLLERLGEPCCDLVLRVVEHDVQAGAHGTHSVILSKRRRA
jgi:hypothetical protein